MKIGRVCAVLGMMAVAVCGCRQKSVAEREKELWRIEVCRRLEWLQQGGHSNQNEFFILSLAGCLWRQMNPETVSMCCSLK
jgi:hypothetical protein